MKSIKLHIQEIAMKSRHIMVKILKEHEKVLKAAKEEQLITSKETPVRSSRWLIRNLEDRRQEDNTLKVLRVKTYSQSYIQQNCFSKIKVKHIPR